MNLPFWWVYHFLTLFYCLANFHLNLKKCFCISCNPDLLVATFLCFCLRRSTLSCPGGSLFRHHFSLLCPTQACPRNLTGGDRRCREDKRQKTNLHKAGARWAVHSDVDTHQPLHLQRVYYIQWQHKVEQHFPGKGAWHCNPREQEDPVTTSLWM
jgi:hypothetical protein